MKTGFTQHPIGHALAVAAGLATSLPALAQSDAIEEIVVTAQNREENVQDVPIKIDVVGQEQFDKSGIRSFKDIERLAPALNITNDNFSVQIAMRGVGTNSTDEAQDTSVVVNVDGEYLNRPNVMNTSLFDIERIEVLRGPQGTLEGRNATGGAINFITRKPGEELAGNASLSYGSFDAVSFEGGIDVPLGDTAALRLAGIYRDQGEGFFDSPNNADPESGLDEQTGVRASLRWSPTDVLDVNFAVEYVDEETVPPNQAFVDLNAPGNAPTGVGCTGGPSGFVEVAPNIPETLCIPQNTNFLSSVDRETFTGSVFTPGMLEQDSTAFRGRVSYDFSGVTATYTGGYRDTSYTGRLGLPVIFQNFNYQNDTKTQSHELRFNGGTDAGLLWQFGTFFFNEELTSADGFLLPSFVLPPFPEFANGAYLTFFERDVDSESLSFFGQVDVPISDRFTIVAGVRHTDNERDAIFGNYPFLGAMPNVRPTQAELDANLARPPGFPPPGFFESLGNSEEEVTWLAGLNYQPDDETLIFGKISTGFKGGGFDSIGPYAPETNTAYEIGLKKNIGAHLFNAGAFLYDYEDLQVSVLLDTSVGGQIFNAGKATIWGIEADTVLYVSDNGRFSASVNYLNAEYDELLAQYAVFCVGGCGVTGVGDLDPVAPGVQQPNLGGNTPPRSPEWTIAAGYDHTFGLNGGGSIVVGAFTRYKSEYFLDIFNYNDSKQEAHTQTDVTVEYRPADENWYIRGFARNIEDERPLTFAGFIAAGPDDIYNFQFGQPSIYGVQVGVEF